MTFEEYWVGVEEQGIFSNTAIKQLPLSLSGGRLRES